MIDKTYALIDFTKMRKSKRIVVCPNCNRKGKLSTYTTGDAGISHKAEQKSWCLNITDHCHFKQWPIV